MRKHKNRRLFRRGAAAVEFAVTSIIVFMFLFAGIEFSRLNVVRHSIDNAVYEAARRGSLPGATADDARQMATDLLVAVGIRSPRITVSPAVLTPTTPTVAVSVEVTADQFAWSPPWFTQGIVLRGDYTLKRETDRQGKPF